VFTLYCSTCAFVTCLLKLEFHDADTDTNTDILATILARMSVSASWNASLIKIV